jgi:hypothetical protein
MGEWQGDPQASIHLDLDTLMGAQWSLENHPPEPEGACQIVDYLDLDLDHGIDQLDDFAEQALAQEVRQYRNENQQKTE